MKLLYRGKTKDVYEDGIDTLRLLFSDRVTKNAAGEVDPGGNAVAEAVVKGQGEACVVMSSTIFKTLENKHHIRTHMVSYDVATLTMIVSKAHMFSPGLEWIARWVCTGSFLRRYGMVTGIHDGMKMPAPVFEITLKDDGAQDPLIVPSALVGLGVVDAITMQKLEQCNVKTLQAIHGMFAERGLDLWDIKIEWGLDADGIPLLIDEISPGSCRAFKLGTNERVTGTALAEYFR